MKNLFKIVVLFVALFAGSASAQNKFGHINFQQLLSIMPEREAAATALQTHGQTLEKEAATIQQELVKKYQEFQQGAEGMTEEIRAAKQAELTDMQNRLQQFQQVAQQGIQKKEQELFQPIFEKARTAINDVAKEQGLLYVFDVSTNVVLYQSATSVDLLPLVKAKLGIQ